MVAGLIPAIAKSSSAWDNLSRLLEEAVSQETIQGYRLSPQQKLLWELHQSAHQLPSVHCLIEITGELDQALLQRALERIVAEHEILRTTFQLLPGMTIPVQVITGEAALVLKQSDLTHLDPHNGAVLIEQLIKDANIPDASVSFRAELVKVSPLRHLLLLSAPALCLDLYSLRVLYQQIAATYQALQSGAEPQAIELMQYADVAEWQNELAESPEAVREAPHADGVALRDADEEAAHGDRGGGRAGRRGPRRHLGRGHLRRLTALPKWFAVLARSGAGEKVSIASIFDGRSFPELRDAVGPLERCVPVTAAFTEQLAFAGLLTELSTQQEMTARLQQFLTPERLGNASDAFRFSWQFHPGKIDQGATKFSFIRSEANGEPFKLRLEGVESSTGALDVTLHADTSFFPETEARLIGERLETLVHALGSERDYLVSELNVVGPTERYKLLEEFNETARRFSAGCVHQLFEEQVQKTPDAPAVVFEDDTLTFAELNSRANRLARHLQQLGVGPEVVVGLCLERSASLIVGLLGILKAGGAYVPLDPGLPNERLKGMLADAGA